MKRLLAWITIACLLLSHVGNSFVANAAGADTARGFELRSEEMPQQTGIENDAEPADGGNENSVNAEDGNKEGGNENRETGAADGMSDPNADANGNGEGETGAKDTGTPADDAGSNVTDGNDTAGDTTDTADDTGKNAEGGTEDAGSAGDETPADNADNGDGAGKPADNADNGKPAEGNDNGSTDLTGDNSGLADNTDNGLGEDRGTKAANGTEIALQEQTITADCPQGTVCEGDQIVLSGMLPEGAVAEALPVDMEVEGQQVLVAYDIAVYASEDQKAQSVKWQPDDTTLAVEISSTALEAANSDVEVWSQSGEDADPEYMTSVSSDNASVTYETDTLTLNAVVVLEKTITASDGKTYHVSVTYDDKAGFPSDAELVVEELTGEKYEEYLGRAAVAYGAAGFNYARFFDISVVDGDGHELAPASKVSVVIELLDNDHAEGNFEVIHFGEETEQLASNTDGASVSFETSGFSAYGIVQGPEAIPVGWEYLTDLTELTDGDIYIGHVDGYFFTDETVTVSGQNPRKGIKKTKPASVNPPAAAVAYHFELLANGNYYISCGEGSSKKYLRNQTGRNNNMESLVLTENRSDATEFTVEIDSNGVAKIQNNGWYVNMRGGAGNNEFAAWNSDPSTDVNVRLHLWRENVPTEEPYNLNGKSYGFMYWTGGTAGKALTAENLGTDSLAAEVLTVMTHHAAQSDKLFVPKDSITMWSFTWIGNTEYYITGDVDGTTMYLRIDENGVSVVSTPDDNCKITVNPGTGAHSGEMFLSNGGTILTYTGEADTGFSVGGSVGSEWLKLVEETELTADYYMTYSAQKVSVSDPMVTNGSRIIIYTRVWNDTKKKYDFYAIDHDGSLVPCYESGDSIQWVGSRLNTMLWNLVEYYWEGTNDPNYYYELYNPYSEKYIAPQVTGNQSLSDNTIGINLNGRRNGQYYTTILAWDDTNYSYAGLKVSGNKIAPGLKVEAEDFYFAIMQDTPADDEVTSVPTVDHKQFGITMRMVNFSEVTTVEDQVTSQEQHDVIGDSVFRQTKATTGLLSTNLDENGYPTATLTDTSLAQLFTSASNNPQEVNHLFIQSTYVGSGYFEFDSLQNYATLDAPGENGIRNFTVHKELGTVDSSSKNTLKHGQFLPYNDIYAGLFASRNGYNLYTAEGKKLSASDPRYNERLYLVQNPDYYFGMEISASFTQTPSGLDDWGHDIIYEFTGDDDFWLYVDGELVIDLGGIHSALPGNVNYRTGEVKSIGADGKTINTTLKEIFYNNKYQRELTANGGDETAAAAAAQNYVDDIFIQTADGKWIFKDYSTHEMKIFYMERGAGASNLHMRFNLASVREGVVELSKEVTGVDSTASVQAEFPYQIWYKMPVSGSDETTENLLRQTANGPIQVNYKDDIAAVPYAETYTVPGTSIQYESVFFLKPGEVIEIKVPDDAIAYKIVECGVDTVVYRKVTADDETLLEITEPDTVNRYHDCEIEYKTTRERSRVTYVNEVNPEALRNLTIVKRLFDETGENEIEDPDAQFAFRLYFQTEAGYEAANMFTYHVKDKDGHYCRWNAGQFESTGVSDYSLFTPAEKIAVSFTTSMNGSISKIPVSYTVEFREILVGTVFQIEERGYEIPDGYSLQKYLYYADASDRDSVDEFSKNGRVTGTIRSGADPLVEVCNLKGWGLRIYKTWNDADYMADRASTFFALFVKDGDGYRFVEMPDGETADSVKELTQNDTTLYWYIKSLEDGKDFSDYVALEVTGVTVDQNHVISYDPSSITPVENGRTITLNGRQQGETGTAAYTYTVTYETGEQEAGSNVREDQVTNSRQGVIIRKMKQGDDSVPLAGAVFTMSVDGNTIGTYTSDETGLITTAFLGEGKSYILKEIKTPQGWTGTGAEYTIVKNSDGNISVTCADSSYQVIPKTESEEAQLIIFNRPYVLQVIKANGNTGLPLEGFRFELHRQKTVDGVVSFDLTPMEGYEDLVSGADGLIAGLDNTLPAGTYQLREKRESVPEAYTPLSKYVVFTVSELGEVRLVSGPEEVGFTEETSDDPSGKVTYTITIRNYSTNEVAPTDYRASSTPYLWMFVFGLAIVSIAMMVRRKRRTKE